jgi:hypothetical protein
MTRYRVVTALAAACLGLFGSVALAPPAEAATIRGGTARSIAGPAHNIAVSSGFSGTMLGRADRPGNPTSDHPSGYAVDYMVDSRAEGDRVARAARAHPRVKYVLWQVKAHRDHVHVSFTR